MSRTPKTRAVSPHGYQAALPFRPRRVEATRVATRSAVTAPITAASLAQAEDTLHALAAWKLSMSRARQHAGRYADLLLA